MRNVSAANRVRCGVSHWLYFENERSASALIVTFKKCTSVPTAGCQQLDKKATNNEYLMNFAEIRIWF